MGTRTQTHCVNGHPLTPPNVYWSPRPAYRNRKPCLTRRCRACTLASNKRWDALKRKTPRRRGPRPKGLLTASQRRVIERVHHDLLTSDLGDYVFSPYPQAAAAAVRNGFLRSRPQIKVDVTGRVRVRHAYALTELGRRVLTGE